jgi:hypothetical protein
MISVRLVAPSTMSGTKTSSWSEFGSAPTFREAVLSTQPCSFDDATVLKNGYGQSQHFFVNAPSFKYKLGSPGGFAAGITAGQNYYINIRNRDAAGLNTCSISDCRMRGGLPN